MVVVGIRQIIVVDTATPSDIQRAMCGDIII
jgi:hypothetical protein